MLKHWISDKDIKRRYHSHPHPEHTVKEQTWGMVCLPEYKTSQILNTYHFFSTEIKDKTAVFTPGSASCSDIWALGRVWWMCWCLPAAEQVWCGCQWCLRAAAVLVLPQNIRELPAHSSVGVHWKCHVAVPACPTHLIKLWLLESPHREVLTIENFKKRRTVSLFLH